MIFWPSWKICRSLSLAVGALQTFAAASPSSSSSSSSPSSPPVDIRLRAPWSAPPLLLEALEAVNTEEPSSFWPLLNHLASDEQRQHLSSSSPRDVYQSVVEALDQNHWLQDTGSRSNWDMALALHSEAPRVAAFWQLANTSGVLTQWADNVARGAIDAQTCQSWVDWYGQVICSAEELQTVLEQQSEHQIKVATYPFDHKIETENATPLDHTAVLYGQPLSSNFKGLHDELYTRATRSNPQNPFRYSLRWVPAPEQEKQTAPTSGYLAGYGASLDLKKVDYLVIDDRKLTHASGAPSIDSESQLSGRRKQQLEDRQWLDGQLLAGKSADHETIESSSQLSAQEIETLDLLATQTIVQSDDPVRAMAQLTQDFPLHANNLARGGIDAPEELSNEIRAMQTLRVRPGAQDIWLNGKPMTTQETVPLKLLKSLRTERSLLDSLTAGPLHLTPGQAIDLLSDSLIGKAQSPDGESLSFFDASDRIERKELDTETGPLIWLNDVETDPAYQRMSPSLKALLRPTYPGQFPQIARNIFNVILVLDLSDHDSCEFLANDLWPLIKRVPLRWGLVPGGLEKGPESDSTKIARLFWHLLDNSDMVTAIHFLRQLSDSNTSDSGGKNSAESAIALFDELIKRLSTSDDHPDGQKISTQVNEREEGVLKYVQRLRVTMDEDPDGHFFFNGQYFPFPGPNIFQMVMQLISIQVQQIARPVYFGQITDEMDVSTYFYDLPTTFTSRSDLVFPRVNEQGESIGPKIRVVDLVQAFDVLKSASKGRKVVEQFLYPDQESSVNATVWVIGDLDTSDGLHLVRQSVQALQHTPYRLGFLHQPSQGVGPKLSSSIAQLLESEQLQTLKPEHVLEIIDEAERQSESSNLVDTGKIVDDAASGDTTQKVLEEDNEASASYVDGTKVRGWNMPRDLSSHEIWQQSQLLLAKLDVRRDHYGLLVNGRLLSGIEVQNITANDIVTLLQNERQRRIDPVVEGLAGLEEPCNLLELDRSEAATAIAYATSAIAVNYFKDETKEGMFAPPVVLRSSIFSRLDVKINRFEVGNKSTAKLRFEAIVDPLSETAQKWSSLFQLVTKMDDVYLSVVLNPRLNITEMPLKRFYRYNAPSKLDFDEQTGAEVAPTISFLDMPQDAVLTMGLDAPPAWLTQASEAVYDLDNIRLRDVPEDGRQTGVVAVYDLKQVLIEGHAREGRNSIPRGLQLVLETPDGSETLDTIVMANLAYFQFRARPGLYRLRIRRGGKSEELYEMKSVGNLGWDSPSIDVTGSDITLDSLDGLTIYPRVEKKPGKELEELLEDLEGDAMLSNNGKRGKSAAEGLAASAKSFLGGLTGSKVKKSVSETRKEGQADINIFTVASGHLYERMTYIMILSVLKNTKSSVKFWFIENFLSPSFKEFMPHFAQEYSFQYEMVTYAWPHWLRSQTEKQRTIWGYKILFLDVLFPLDVDKVIFVDSDQVVRTDLKELTEIDLHGAPYGFPPMGDDSYDMDGYRFWKRGYWKDFLKGRPYHISALYVVDLQRFRSVAAGDKLRGQYQALSQDAGSLANLDQDLPQTLMFHLPIHTLEKEWLWCETWCSYDWLDKAKTIDLCSNPKTHEAKLDRARRQIPEWTPLDEEVQRFARRISEEKKGGIIVEEKDGSEDVVETTMSHQSPHDEL
ncbi:unnamed protein product [Sympodiomycopsis kandeliae]